jgi:transposase
MRGRATAKDLKAQAIAALIAGESPTDVANRFKVPRTSVRNWKLALGPEKLAEVSRNSTGRLDELICDYLEELFRSLSAQAQRVQEPGYLEKQSAAGIAALYDTMSDRALLMMTRLKL